MSSTYDVTELSVHMRVGVVASECEKYGVRRGVCTCAFPLNSGHAITVYMRMLSALLAELCVHVRCA